MKLFTTSYRAAIDIGGTFTDFVVRSNDGQILSHKLSSTTDDYGRGIVTGLQTICRRHGIAPSQITEIIHGTTVAGNTILEEKGAKTALITTFGFRDILELRRVRISELYNMNYSRSAPLVPRRRRLELRERMTAMGEVEQRLDVHEVQAVLHRLATDEVEALAICLLHSYANPAHEKQVEALAREMLPASCFITASYTVLPQIQEYERASTTVINAYLGPVIGRYCRGLKQALVNAGFEAPLRMMQSSGGILSLDDVIQFPARILESGPAAGVIGAAAAGVRWGHPNLLTVDMGGTTAKAALVEDGRPSKTNEYEIGAGINVSSRLVKGRGHALKLPVIDISEIGAGGGSIARVSSHDRLSVGPDSAGAVPGPACYDAGGTAATLTDAMVTMGYLNPRYLCGGDVSIDAHKAADALQVHVATPLKLDLLQAAYGVYILAATTMTRAVKAVSTFRGRDPRDFTLFAFGGNGPLMAAEIASALEIKKILIPPLAGLYSAVGLLNADIEREASRTWLRPLTQVTDLDLDEQFKQLERTLLLAFDHSVHGQLHVRREADLRYHGQAFELSAGCEQAAAGLVSRARESFVREHQRTYGHGTFDDPIDVVTLRVIATLKSNTGGGTTRLKPKTGEAGPARNLYYGNQIKSVLTPILNRGELARRIFGPFVVEELDTTILVPPGWSAQLGDEAAIILEKD